MKSRRCASDAPPGLDAAEQDLVRLEVGRLEDHLTPFDSVHSVTPISSIVRRLRRPCPASAASRRAARRDAVVVRGRACRVAADRRREQLRRVRRRSRPPSPARSRRRRGSLAQPVRRQRVHLGERDVGTGSAARARTRTSMPGIGSLLEEVADVLVARAPPTAACPARRTRCSYARRGSCFARSSSVAREAEPLHPLRLGEQRLEPRSSRRP